MSEILIPRENFILDSENIVKQIQRVLDEDFSLKDLYRHIHSLKSGAGFAGLKHMEAAAHRLEDILALSLKRGEDIPGAKGIFDRAVDYFSENLTFWKVQGRELSSEALITAFHDAFPGEDVSDEVPEERDSFFSPFEKELLQEARMRGDSFYRITCRIDDEELMLYARFFLVINNLELLVNVIRVFPDISRLKKGETERITLYITTDKERKEIYRAVNIDMIKELELSRLDYNDTLREDVSPVSAMRISTVPVESSRIDELNCYVSDLTGHLKDIGYNNPEVDRLLRGMSESVMALSFVSLKELFAFFIPFTAELAERLGCRVVLQCEPGDFTVDRHRADLIRETLMHLIRNSVDHGIESPEERSEAGKKPEGTLILKASKVKDNLVITLSDDGRGIDTREVLSRGVKNNYITQGEEISLLSLLSLPGFSTARDVNVVSGRGIGLDVVLHNISHLLGGKVRMNNTPGKGLCIDLLIPPEKSALKLTLFKSRGQVYALPAANAVKKFCLKGNKLQREAEGQAYLTLGGEQVPVYSVLGRLSTRQESLSEPYALLIRYLGKKAVIPVDEFVLEKSIYTSEMLLQKTDTSFIRDITLSGKKQNYSYLLPSFITA